MTGTLLGGFRVWLQDGCGQPLSAPGGRASFFKAGTSVPSSEPLEVYNSADMDVSLGTVVPTDAHGYLPDIWLRSDYLYDIKVERRVQADPELWETLYEVKNVGRIIDEKAESYYENSTIVDNITTLKTVDPDKFYLVYVAGYYETGDWGEPALFVYEDTCSKASDDGAYVRPNSITSDSKQGRWVQVFSRDVVDVRRFGALPDLSDELQDVTGKIKNCITYCMNASEHKRNLSVGFLEPGNYYISGKLDLSYYKYTDTTQNTYYAHYIVNDGVVFNGYLESATELTLGPNTDCLSQSSLVAGYAELVVPAYMTRVDTRWFGETESPVLNGITMRYSGRRNGDSDNDFEFDMTDGKFSCCRLKVDNLFFDDNNIYWLENNTLSAIIGFEKGTINFGPNTANWEFGEFIAYVNGTGFTVGRNTEGGAKTTISFNGFSTDGNLDVEGTADIGGNTTIGGNADIDGDVSVDGHSSVSGYSSAAYFSPVKNNKDNSIGINFNFRKTGEFTIRKIESDVEENTYGIIDYFTEITSASLDANSKTNVFVIMNDRPLPGTTEEQGYKTVNVRYRIYNGTTMEYTEDAYKVLAPGECVVIMRIGNVEIDGVNMPVFWRLS